MLDGTLIDRPAEEGARLVALEYLERCDEEVRRLGASGDPEALHDFRVAVRRLRTALRAFRPWLAGSAGRDDERRLRKLARRSNAARDAEVHLAYLAEHHPRAGARRQPGVHLLRERLRERLHDGPATAKLASRFAKISRRLAARIPTVEARVEPSPSTVAFGAALASILREELEVVRSRVDAIAGAADDERVHRARIAVKRLRYLLEVLRATPRADARPAVRELKRLQELLGALHDAHTLAHELELALVDAAAERARRRHAAAYDPDASGVERRDAARGAPEPGLLAVTRGVRARRDALFADLERAWRSGALDALATEILRLAAALGEGAGGRAEPARHGGRARRRRRRAGTGGAA